MPIDSRELLFVVDENNNPLPPASREEVHARGYWHRNSHVWITNSKRQTLCGKRSMLKDTNPGKWDPIFGGHTNAGDEYIVCAIKELKEELNLDIAPEELQFHGIFRKEALKEFSAIYLLKKDIDIDQLKPEKDELDLTEWKDNDELTEINIANHPDWVSRGYENEILSLLVQDKK